MNGDLISLEAAINHIKSVFCQGCKKICTVSDRRDSRGCSLQEDRSPGEHSCRDSGQISGSDKGAADEFISDKV